MTSALPTTASAAPAEGTLSQRLRAHGRPRVEAWAQLPMLTAVAAGDLPLERFRDYLQQDYLYLREYARLYSALAAKAPDEHVEHLIGLASNLVTVELAAHRRMGAGFGAVFTGIEPSPVSSAYIAFLHSCAADFGAGLVAALPCLWGYGVALAQVAKDNAGPYRPWLEVYTSGEYTSMIERHCRMIDETGMPIERALALFDQAMEHELAFWNQVMA